MSAKPTPFSPMLDRLTILVALLAFGTGLYAIYSRLPREQVGMTVATLLHEPIVDPVHLHGRNIDFVTDFYGHRYKGNTSDLIDSHVVFYGAWEKWILYFLRDCLEAVGGEDSVFVDVGANSGLHTLFMSSFAHAVHAIEPYPPALNRIADAVERNSLTNVVIHPVGLGAEEATLPFFEPPDWNGGTGSFLQTMHDSNHEAGLRLRIIRADGYFPTGGIERFDLIKIDIEGFERFALEGLRGELAKNRPVVVMELSIDPENDALFSSMDQLRATLPERYEIYGFATFSRHTGSYTLEPFEPEFGKETQYDVILAPSEKADRIPKTADYSEEYRRLSSGEL